MAAPEEPGLGREQAQPNVLAVGRRADLSGRFWALLALTGVGAGLAGGGLMRLLHATEHLAWRFDAGTLLDAARRAPVAWHLGVVVLAGVLVAAGLAGLRFAKGGHGGDVTLAIWFRQGRTPALMTLGRAVLSIVIVGMGAPVGREGALKQTGALIGSRLGDLIRLSAPQQRLLTACGAGAGMAAAYNIPLGGALFALEVLLGSISLPFAAPALACSMIATCASWLLLPATPTYRTPAYALSAVDVGWALVAGPIIGIAAVAYARLIAWADGARGRSRLVAALAPLGAFGALALASLALPQLLGNGLDEVQLAFVGAAGPLALVTLLAFARPLATAICLRSGAPGGLFTPTMSAGALGGAALADVWNAGLPWRADPGACAAIGAGAMIAAATEGPISAVVSVLELGRHIDLLIVPLGVATIGAMLVVRLRDAPSIYSARLARAAAPVARKGLTSEAAGRGVSDRFIDISAAAHAATALQHLIRAAAETPPLPVIVVDEAHRPVGVLSSGLAAGHNSAAQPIELVTAGDLAEPAPVRRWDALDVRDGVRTKQGYIVVTGKDERLLGFVAT